MLKTLKQPMLIALAVTAFGIAAMASAVRAASFEGVTPPRRYYAVRPLEGMTADQVRGLAAKIGTLPMWHYSVTSPLDRKTYQGFMVGRSPFFGGMRTTTIQVFLVPTIVTTADGSIFDPTMPDAACLSGSKTPVELMQGSPLFNDTGYTMNGTNIGSTQYIDAFQRANFFNAPGNVGATGDRYHTRLSVKMTPAITITLPASKGVSYTFPVKGVCEPSAIVDFTAFDNIVTKKAIPALAKSGAGPNSLVFFITHNVVAAIPLDPANPGNNCCVIGYHGAFGSATKVQTYAVADLDSTGVFSVDSNVDVSSASHEIGEWLDDPLINNRTPAWGHVGQVPDGCQANLEDGDPLSDPSTIPPIPVAMTNGFTYDVQELAFFSWFYRQSPSMGAGGTFSDNGSFSTDAGSVCL